MEEKRREIEMIDDEIDKNEELRQWSPMERKYYAKMDEAQALINNRDATPEDIKKSNQMFEELNKRHPEIDAYQKQKRERYENNRLILVRRLLKAVRELRQLEEEEKIRELRQLEEEKKRILEPEIEVEFLTQPLRF